MTSRLLERLAVVATIIIFCAAIVVLVREFAGVSPRRNDALRWRHRDRNIDHVGKDHHLYDQFQCGQTLAHQPAAFLGRNGPQTCSFPPSS